MAQAAPFRTPTTPLVTPSKAGAGTCTRPQKQCATGSSAMSYQTFFAKRFAKFLRENFTSPEQIALCFGVTARQAQNWLDEVSAPRGHVVARAFTDPSLASSAQKHLTEAA